MFLKSQLEDNIWLVQGVSIFKSKEMAITNSVNVVGVSGAGIAKEFKRRYPDNYEAYHDYCQKELLKIGDVFVFDLETNHNPKFIINFPSKKHWKPPSQLSYIEEGLKGLTSAMAIHQITSVALPQLGCGKYTGRLDWNEVKELIISEFRKHPELTCVMYT